ncbi:PH domain-containing protein [Enterococcus alcedinis]|uniref:Bacterial Pleckstrin homology domain-containing protein n=1 Tax=Enterococcus alcedinis TaxID=1274384 RepID=A0A917JGB3_9ENTE|nr:PH domain-containing protein [Enterococcus alcedinis]MBP2103194.1 putative membrane protein [Enterococcus alcedinis]GGI66758.1 hypothetical protein GCM10011482_24120 [Enterococcus alcedinis]
MNYIFIGMMIFICFIQAFTLGLAANPHQQVILENTLPKEYLNHPDVRALAKTYRQRLFQIATLFSLLSLSLLFISYESVQLTIFWLLLMTSIAGTFLCKIYYIREMKQLITQKQWQPAVEPQLIDTNLILNKNQKMVSVRWLYLSYLPSLPLSWYTLQVTDFSTASILFGSSTLLFVLMLINHYYIGRIPAKSLTSNSTINQRYNDLTKHHWSYITILLNWLMLPLLFLPVFMTQTTGILAYALIIAYSCLVLFLVFFTIGYLYSLRKKQDQLLMQSSDFRYNGEDQYWTYGVYINPNDPKLFVPDRIGMNIGMNLGRTAGKVAMGFITILLIGTFFITVIPAYLYDFTANPLKLETTETSIVLSAPFSPTATIPIDIIETIELVEELPHPLIKTFGIATDNYALGRFTSQNRSIYLFVDHRSQPIIKIQTKSTDYYYTNKSPDQTLSLYQGLNLP